MKIPYQKPEVEEIELTVVSFLADSEAESTIDGVKIDGNENQPGYDPNAAKTWGGTDWDSWEE